MEVLEYRCSQYNLSTHHVPGKVCQPVYYRFDPAHELQMLRFTSSLINQKQNKCGRNKSHSKDYANGDHHIQETLLTGI